MRKKYYLESTGEHTVLFPHSLRNKFQSLRVRFGSTIFQIRRILARHQLDLDLLKGLVIDLFPDLQHQLSDVMSINRMIEILKRKCSITDVGPLEVVVDVFDIVEAEIIIRAYQEDVKRFCKDVSVSLCLEHLYSSDKTIAFVLNWNPDHSLLQDIQDVLHVLDPLKHCHIEIRVC